MRDNLTVQELIDQLNNLVVNDARVMKTTPTNITRVAVFNDPVRHVELASADANRIQELKERIKKLEHELNS